MLPYDDVDFATVLDALAYYRFIRKYELDGKTFGCIPSFTDHQVINNKEAKSLIPPPPPENQRDFHASFTRAHASRMEGKEGKGKEHTKSVCNAVAQLFGREYQADPKERMPNMASWYTQIECEAEILEQSYGTEKAIRQITAYVSYCKLNKRKLIGTVWKVSKTILEADWIALTAPDQPPKELPFAEAAYNRSLWKEDAWRTHYAKQIRDNPEFRNHFQITQ